MELEKLKGKFSEEELKEAFKEALDLNNKVLVELMLAVVGVDVSEFRSQLIRHYIIMQDIDKVKTILQSYKPTEMDMFRLMLVAVESDNKEIIDILYHAGGSLDLAMHNALERRNTELAKKLIIENRVIPEITGGSLEMYPSFVDWIVTNEYEAGFSESAVREYCSIIRARNRIGIIKHLKKRYPTILQQLIEDSIKGGYTQIVKKLIEVDAIEQDVNQELFLRAIAGNHYYVIKHLVDAGKYKVTDTEVLYAIINEHARLLKFLLEKKQGETDKDAYRGAIRRAVQHDGKVEVVKVLLEAGVECEFKSWAIYYSALEGNTKMVKVFLEHLTTPLVKKKFQNVIRMVESKRLHGTANYMKKYLEENPEKFA